MKLSSSPARTSRCPGNPETSLAIIDGREVIGTLGVAGRVVSRDRELAGCEFRRHGCRLHARARRARAAVVLVDPAGTIRIKP